MKRLGLLINPTAGLGGSVGLKGSDQVIQDALQRGAKPTAQNRVKATLERLLPMSSQLLILTYPGEMGGRLAAELGFPVQLCQAPEGRQFSSLTESCAADTIALAKTLKQKAVDLLLFAGGDGTARDLYTAVGSSFPVLGIPTGVKMHSPVFAVNPVAAGTLACQWLSDKLHRTEEREVLDLDESLYRLGKLGTRLFGYLSVPVNRPLLQCRKAPTPPSDIQAAYGIASQLIQTLQPDVDYLVGAGTTLRALMEQLHLKNTLIGVDLIRCEPDGSVRLLANDLYGSALCSAIRPGKTQLLVSVTGGQGYLFGRGNQQLTPEILRRIGKAHILIAATPGKLAALQGRPLLLDLDDSALASSLCGFYKVITGYGEYTMCRVCTV